MWRQLRKSQGLGWSVAIKRSVDVMTVEEKPRSGLICSCIERSVDVRTVEEKPRSGLVWKWERFCLTLKTVLLFFSQHDSFTWCFGLAWKWERVCLFPWRQFHLRCTRVTALDVRVPFFTPTEDAKARWKTTWIKSPRNHFLLTIVIKINNECVSKCLLHCLE